MKAEGVDVSVSRAKTDASYQGRRSQREKLARARDINKLHSPFYNRLRLFGISFRFFFRTNAGHASSTMAHLLNMLFINSEMLVFMGLMHPELGELPQVFCYENIRFYVSYCRVKRRRFSCSIKIVENN